MEILSFWCSKNENKAQALVDQYTWFVPVIYMKTLARTEDFSICKYTNTSGHIWQLVRTGEADANIIQNKHFL